MSGYVCDLALVVDVSACGADADGEPDGEEDERGKDGHASSGP